MSLGTLDLLFFFAVMARDDIINHHFMLVFVDSGLYFVQDENNFINPLLQVGSGSGSGEPKINGSDLIRILIPEKNSLLIKQFILSFNKLS